MEDDDWPVVAKNQAKLQAVWRRLTRILGREGEALQVSGFFLIRGPVGAAFLAQKPGWSPLAWNGSWGDSRIRWHNS